MTKYHFFATVKKSRKYIFCPGSSKGRTAGSGPVNRGSSPCPGTKFFSHYMNYAEQSLALHRRLRGKIALAPKMRVQSREDLSLLYTPGVGAVSTEIGMKHELVWEYTSRGNWVAIVTDGSAVLGLGNLGPEAALPVMEGKAILFKEFAGVDAFPICLKTQNTEEIIQIVKNIAPSFGGINLEDISAPRCFEIERRLKEELDIPVLHDDQHGTAVVVLAGLINALKVVQKQLQNIRVVISGAGAAGTAIVKILLLQGVKDIVVVDRKGILFASRDDLNDSKKELARITNPQNISGTLFDACKKRDVFIGVSSAGILREEMIRAMNPSPIIFVMANPIPEIMPELARRAGAGVVATGRSDFPNQINNVLAFPGIFRGALDIRAKKITEKMLLAAAYALSKYVENPNPEKIIPDPLDKNVAHVVAEAVRESVL